MGCARFVSRLDQYIAELNELAPILIEAKKESLLVYYQECLERWSNPTLSDAFRELYPLLIARLNAPQKIRVFLRGAEFRAVSPDIMGEVLEEIIFQHQVNGKSLIIYNPYRGNDRHKARRIIYHTQVPAWTLTRLALPDNPRVIASSSKGLIIDWRPKEEREAAGDRW